jgi:uncharacterized membrane protein YdjX (TVP38/TMEM64 family)
MTEPPGGSAKSRRSLGRVVPVAVLVAGFVLFFALGLERYLSFDTLREHRGWLTAQVEANGLLAAAAFIVVYAVVIGFSIPGGAVLTITAGFLFGTVPAAVCAVIGATLGATGVFLAARTAFGDVLRTKAGPALRRMEDGFRENALNYLLVLRLIPLFPFWLVNLVPAFLGIPLRTYVIGTFVGIIPGTFVYASLGNGLGAILDAGDAPDLKIIFTPEILIPIVGLSVLALLPVVYKKIKARRAAAD